MKKVKLLAIILVTVMLCTVLFAGCAKKNTEYTVSIETMTNGVITTQKNTMKKGETVELSIVAENGYKVKNGSIKVVLAKSEYVIGGTTFVMPGENVTVKAEFEKMVEIPAGQDYFINEDKTAIYFGYYPQTIASDSALAAMGTTPDTDGYYTSTFDGAKYVKVAAKPYSTSEKNPYRFSNGKIVSKDSEYFFKVEPIKWNIIKKADGNTLILADNILDAQAFLKEENYKKNRAMIGNTYNIREGVPEKTFANNWQYSDIRAWLNDTFYNASFNDSAKAIINTSELDNNKTSYYGDGGSETNKFATSQINTNDKVFFLSVTEIATIDPKKSEGVNEYGFILKRNANDPMKIARLSDYAINMGAWMHTASDADVALYNGNGHWWLRSSGDKSGLVSRITADGTAVTIPGINVYKDMMGVRPAMNLNLTIA